ncbi:MAG: DNA-binding protein [Epsilonproteobacteria bacterium]|nr:DNA-binding protein [Campylobacterota bacterium]OIO14039.1 MAG: DNA-binding protein [Helicobacteraceae bacterium CG1_02_36_14]PIP11461.1 MAG: DNA-binding protein [Sulfurimonas sp. CG23_combo_of_CG06-09_8_20_14_all_36_33]PIS25174.1 MAG: DNA-binding protein [Sulfurimonas sp. CG08_land_8_20_14_0_20_36_33]PIU36191.1 MAG: DNA-binding protein [Sulfurimonas sp. CG07_land_8_20_14_0_80_36_56]PIV04722.1 MAG: DNA-binding protein [Sulfurimonas sp. CG03_land_8_20_14_0_80_36_25]PIV35631.1 MAG: DNA-bindi
MTKDLTSSTLSRQNILNNNYALEQIESNLSLGGIYWHDEALFTKTQVAEILEIDERTIDRYLESNKEELSKNGYRILKGKELKDFKNYVDDIDVVDIAKAPSLGVFSFRTVLNIAMLVTESEKAKAIRSKILDIVIDVMAQKSGGHTKYINQRDEAYLPSAYKEYSYRKEFTDALDNYLQADKWKYGKYTNKIYEVIFLENAAEYKKILDLKEKDKIRETMYAEVLNAISSFEHGLAVEMQQEFERLGRKLTTTELETLIQKASQNPYLLPHISDARAKMASRDLCFRDALHHKLESYIQSVPQGDFDKFLGETSKSLEERLSDPETLDVLKRLKDR